MNILSDTIDIFLALNILLNIGLLYTSLHVIYLYGIHMYRQWSLWKIMGVLLGLGILSLVVTQLFNCNNIGILMGDASFVVSVIDSLVILIVSFTSCKES